MGFRLAVSGGAENINLDEKTIQKVTFSSDSATDSNARATDFGIAVKITGKMLYKVGADGEDGTLGLSKWSQVPSEQADCYRNAQIEPPAPPPPPWARRWPPCTLPWRSNPPSAGHGGSSPPPPPGKSYRRRPAGRAAGSPAPGPAADGRR